MIDAEIDGYVANLVVNGIAVMPLVESELDRQLPVRRRIRSDDPDDLRSAWSELASAWDKTVERARALTPAQQHQQANGEWSVVQTMRHLVFVVDAWLSRAVLGEPMPYHPAGQLPEFMDGAAEMGIDTGATPSFDDVARLWHDRRRLVADYLATATAADLTRACEPYEGPLWPPIEPETAPVRCVRVVLDESLAHLQFARRDLDIVEATGNEPR